MHATGTGGCDLTGACAHQAPITVSFARPAGACLRRKAGPHDRERSARHGRHRDTHGRTHHAAIIDTTGRVLGSAEFAANTAGYRGLLTWMRRFGEPVQVGIEGTGTYGAGICRYLQTEGVSVVEVDRPDRRMRRMRGKSDPIDAEAAARSVLAGTATALPKRRDGIVESVRVLRTVRSGSVKARSAALCTLKATM